MDNEHDVVEKCTALLNRLEAKVGPNCPERDLNTVMELLKVDIKKIKIIICASLIDQIIIIKLQYFISGEHSKVQGNS